jgi:hypothetical protein
MQGKEEVRSNSSGECCGATKGAVCGNSNEKHVSTSFVERQNLTMRMSMRHITRLTDGFPKKIENHEHAVAIQYMHYNFTRIHKSLRIRQQWKLALPTMFGALRRLRRLSNSS